MHLLLLRAEETTIGVYAAYWVGRERPNFDRRASFYYYWDIAGLALAVAYERREIERELSVLHEAAHCDRLTGLPNTLALETELHRHAEGQLGVLALDFDGLREANTTLGYLEGGDALIAHVGAALAGVTRPGEFAARLHTAGDEFVVLLPGADEHAAAARATEIESALDPLDLPPQLKAVYRGASVGAAARRPSETPGQTVGRAIETMRQRKLERGGGRRP